MLRDLAKNFTNIFQKLSPTPVFDSSQPVSSQIAQLKLDDYLAARAPVLERLIHERFGESLYSKENQKKWLRAAVQNHSPVVAKLKQFAHKSAAIAVVSHLHYMNSILPRTIRHTKAWKNFSNTVDVDELARKELQPAKDFLLGTLQMQSSRKLPTVHALEDQEIYFLVRGLNPLQKFIFVTAAVTSAAVLILPDSLVVAMCASVGILSLVATMALYLFRTFFVAQTIVQESGGQYVPALFKNRAGTILIMSISSREASATLVHEMAHELQEEKSPYFDSNPALFEGHAIGLERAWAKQQNTDEMRNFLKSYEAYLLASAYLYLSEQGKIPNNPKIIQGLKTLFYKVGSVPHAIGGAAFMVAEEEVGFEIYRRVLLGDVSFFEKPPDTKKTLS